MTSQSASAFGQVARTLDASTKFRVSVHALSGVLIYLIIGRLIQPGFTEFWWYQVLQTSATLSIVITLETTFAAEGGLAWQTHLIAFVTTLADTLGTAGDMYDRFPPYDKIVHFWAGAAFAAAAYEVIGFLRQRGIFDVNLRRQAVLAVVASLLLAGLAWETYEYLSDVVFGSGRVNGRQDTVNDLISDTFGAMLAVGVLLHRDMGRRSGAAETQHPEPASQPVSASAGEPR